MTKRLEQAMEKAKALPEAEQNALADVIFQEMAWDKLLEETSTKLESLAKEALSEYHAGKTRPLEF
jgi:hypothetical protein